MVVAASLLLPTGVLVMDPNGLSPYGPAKWAAVSTVGAAAAALALGRQPVRVLAGAGQVWALLLTALCLSALTGLDGLYAWIGTPERNFGALTWALCALTFIVGQQLEDAGDARWVVAAGVLTAGAAGAWAAVEAFGWEPVRVDVDPGRLLGPLGSAAFLGAAAVLLLPLAIGCGLDATWSRRSRTVAGVCAALSVVALIGAGARAAWLGALGTAVTVLVLRRRWVVARRRRAALALTAALVTVLAMGVALGAGGRLGSVADGGAGGGSSRIDEWRVAARVVARHPFGVGPEGYRIAFAEGVDASYERRHGRAVIPDRAHNSLLDVTLAAGLPGLVAFGVLIGFVGRRLIRALRQGPGWTAGAAAGVLAYWMQSLFLFPIATLEPAAWLIAGLVVVQVADPEELRAFRPPRLAGAVVGALGVLAAVAGTSDVLADRRARAALVALDSGRITVAEDHAEGAVALRPDVIRYRLAAARAHAASATVEGDAEALDAYDAALKVSPADPVVRSEKGAFLLALAQRTVAPGDISQARAYLEALVSEDPQNAELQLRVGVARALGGDTAGAETAWRFAASLAPRSPSALLNLAELFVRQNLWIEAGDAAEAALQRDPTSERARRLLAQSAEHGT